jgi:hypothetical protein
MPPVVAVFQAIGAYVASIAAAAAHAAIHWAAANVFLANVIGQVALSVGVALLTSLFAKKQGSNIEAGKINVRLTEPPRWICAGQSRQGGGVLFGEFDASGNFWYVVVHADSILTDTVQYYFDDVPVTVDGGGNVTTDDFCLTPKKDPYSGSGTKVSYFTIWTTTHSETDPTPPAVSALAAAFPGKWTADHKLVGTTYSVIRIGALDIEHRYKIYRWRGPFGLGEPSVSVVGKWSHAFDPRDEAQTNGSPATYGYSEGNPVLIWAWFRTHRYGRNKTRASINWDRIAEQAAICDQSVVGAFSTQNRYTCGTSIPENKERNVAEQEILMSMDAQLIFDDDGKCWPRVGYYEAATLALSRNRDIVAMESVEAQNGESETQGVIVRYMNTEANYSVQPSAAWLNPLYYVEGEAATFLTVDIATCQNHNQAMRLAKAIGMRSQSAHKVLPTVGLRGLKARQERIVALNYDNTFAGEYEIVTPVEVDEYGIFCGFGAVPIDADRWTLLAGEERPAPVISETDAVAAPAAPTGVVVIYNDGRIEATFDPTPRADVMYQFQFILAADIATDLWSSMSVSMDDNFAYSGSITLSETFSVRWRALASSGRDSGWSTPVDVTPPATPMPPPVAMSATDDVGEAILVYRNPADIRLDFVRIYRGTSAVFGSAVAEMDVPGSPSAVQTVTDDDGGTLAAGTYWWWFEAHGVGSIVSTVAGPVTVTVT